MSLSYQKLNTIECRDERIIIDNKRDFAVLKGAADVTPKVYTTQSISQNNVSFTTLPPSSSTIVDRKVFLTICVRLSFVSLVQAGKSVFNVNRDAPRSFPISSALDSLSCQINGTKVSVEMADIIQALMRFNTDAKLKTSDYSLTPTALDQSQSYGDLIGWVRNPLGIYGDSHEQTITGRGGANYNIVSNPSNPGPNPALLTGAVECRFTEPLFLLTPFIFGKYQSGGLYNIQTLDWTFNWLTQAANRMWSHDDSDGSVFQSSTFTFGGQIGGPNSTGFSDPPSLLITWLSQPELSIMGPNMSITYPYFNLERLNTEYTGVAAITPAGPAYRLYQSNNIQLKSIPRRMYIFMRQRNSDLYDNASNTDTFFAINNVNIQFNNRNGIFSTASQEQLYLTSVKNHCNMDWASWSGQALYSGNSNFVNKYYGTGSICCFEFGTDIANQTPLQAPGVSGQFQLSVTVSAANLSSKIINATLYIVPVYEGTFTIPHSGGALLQIGVLSSTDVLDAGKNGYVSYHDVQKVNGGGDFFSNIKDFFVNKVAPFLRQSKIASNLARAIPVVGEPISQSLRNLGYGEGEGGEIGGFPIGGGPMERSRLRRRLMQ